MAKGRVGANGWRYRGVALARAGPVRTIAFVEKRSSGVGAGGLLLRRHSDRAVRGVRTVEAIVRERRANRALRLWAGAGDVLVAAEKQDCRDLSNSSEHDVIAVDRLLLHASSSHGEVVTAPHQ